ncbi:MAG: TetR/AcrR family transcriptional regulator [Deltaproteobacteria bacterium]|nr:TetR/AcrR family transcriptional regulator [Deltaproteobacteria bacterium]
MSFTRDFPRREPLIEAALNEFVRQGYEQASLNDILAASGVSKGKFYHYFDSKQALYLGLVELLIQRKKEHFAANPVGEQKGFFNTLRAQLDAGQRFALAQPDLYRFSQAFLRERGTPIFTVVMETYGLGGDSAVAQLVAAYHARGAFAESLSLEFVTRAVLLVLNGLPQLLDLSSPDDLNAHLDELMGFLERGLGR